MMLLIRRFEERASQQYQAQKIGGFCHLYIGQEAVVAGAIAATRPRRLHHHGLSRSRPCARPRHERGCLHGGAFRQRRPAVRAGSAVRCITSIKEHHMYGGHAIVGAHVPLAAGMAFASKYRKRRPRHALFFRRRRDQPGRFHEALNLAGLFKLPVIFICENNFFAMGTSVNVRLRSSKSSIAPKATTFRAKSLTG